MSSGEARSQTAGYFAGHVALGLVSASLGPTLPALAARLASETESLGLLFTARGLGYLLGSLACGRLYDRRPAHPLLVVALVVMATSMALVPRLDSRTSLLAIMVIVGAAQGLLDVGNNTTLVRLHGPKAAPFLNALHCAYGVGAIVAPMIVVAAGRLDWAYASLALSMLPVAAWLLVIPSPALTLGPARSEPIAAPHRPVVLAAFVLLFALCQAAEAGFGGWLYVIASSAGFTEQGAARILSAFWTTFTLGRLLAIGVAIRVEARTMLAADLLVSLASVVVMLLVPGPLGLWIGTLGLGLGLASVFPVAFALAGRYLGSSGALTSRIFVGASVGTMVMPWLLGRSFELGSSAPMIVLLIDLALAAGLLAVIVTRFEPL